MSLVPITPSSHDVVLSITYATYANFTGRPVYANPLCYLHQDAEECLRKAVQFAKPLGFKLKIFDAFRPQAAQQKLWNHTPDPVFVADPTRGSNHTRGIAVDLTLIDARTGDELEMGTPFDDFTPSSFHSDLSIHADAQRNRKLLLGIMTVAGWDYYEKEWWHFQLFNPREYPLIQEGVESEQMMGADPMAASV